MSSPEKLPKLQLTRNLYQKASRKRVPLSGTFELSPVCNFAYRMCYVRKTAREVASGPRPILTLDDWRAIAREAREAGMLFLLLTGGEPLLWPDFWTLYEELIQMGFLVSINTNGSLIDAEAVARFHRLPPWRINITLYGASDETYRRLCGVGGVFTRVTKAIESLQEAGVAVKLNGSLTPYNVGDLERLTAYAESHKLILETATYMFPPIRRDPGMVGVNDRFTPEEAARWRIRCYELQSTPQQYETYLRRILRGYVDPPALDEHCIDPVDGRIRCRADNAAFWITWDGWLTPCGMMPEPKVDLTGRPFGDAWRELTKRSDDVALSGVCSKCWNQTICHTCAAMAVAETGRTEGIPQYLCAVAREMQRIAAETLAHRETDTDTTARTGAVLDHR